MLCAFLSLIIRKNYFNAVPCRSRKQEVFGSIYRWVLRDVFTLSAVTRKGVASHPLVLWKRLLFVWGKKWAIFFQWNVGLGPSKDPFFTFLSLIDVRGLQHMTFVIWLAMWVFNSNNLLLLSFFLQCYSDRLNIFRSRDAPCLHFSLGEHMLIFILYII